MPKKERPLPQPPRGKRFSEAAGKDELMFDKLQEAAAEGTLEKFIKENISGGEYAQKLTEMMMGMSGMPVAGMSRARDAEMEKAMAQVPTDVLQAVREGNVENLQGLLKREQEKRGGAKEFKKGKGKAGEKTMAAQENAVQLPGSLVEKEVVDSLLEIGVDNGLSMDWLILRALKLYIKKYRDTGQL